MAPPLSHKSGGQGSCAPTPPKYTPTHNAKKKKKHCSFLLILKSTEHINHTTISWLGQFTTACSLSRGPLYAASGAPGGSVYSGGMRN